MSSSTACGVQVGLEDHNAARCSPTPQPRQRGRNATPLGARFPADGHRSSRLCPVSFTSVRTGSLLLMLRQGRCGAAPSTSQWDQYATPEVRRAFRGLVSNSSEPHRTAPYTRRVQATARPNTRDQWNTGRGDKKRTNASNLGALSTTPDLRDRLGSTARTAPFGSTATIITCSSAAA
jgi:hypothetical protein